MIGFLVVLAVVSAFGWYCYQVGRFHARVDDPEPCRRQHRDEL